MFICMKSSLIIIYAAQNVYNKIKKMQKVSNYTLQLKIFTQAKIKRERGDKQK